MKFITRGGATVALILSLIINSITVFAGGGGSVTAKGGSGDGPDNYLNGYVFAWFDEGGFAAHTAEKDYKPVQGWYDSSDDSWHNATNNQKPWNYFIDQRLSPLVQKMGQSENWGDYSDEHWHGFTDGWSTGITRDQVETAAKTACQKAIARANEANPTNPTTKARIVGMGANFYSTDTTHQSGWSSGYEDPKDLDFKDIIARAGNASELPQTIAGVTIGWDENPGSNIPSSKADENWREYIYRIGAIDNPSVTNVNARFIVLAVADNWPETNGYLALKKVSANTNITG